MTSRAGFTLFELVLAVALSAVLLILLGAAINLFLLECNASRSDVEEAQLARAVLEMIATDLRRVIVFEPQDTSTVTTIADAVSLYNVDEIDSAALATFSGSASSASSANTSSATESTSSSTESGEEEPALAVPGIYGNLEELLIDVSQLPRTQDWASLGAQGDADTTAQQPANYSDVKSVRYFINRSGQPTATGAPTSSLSIDSPTGGGLYRQEIDRAARAWAEESANSAVLTTGGRLVAPEVVGLQLRYFDGTDSYELWDTEEARALPVAVEVRIWILSQDADDRTSDGAATALSANGIPAGANEYLLTVALPIASASDATSTSAETL